MKRFGLDRRTFLRGLGVSVALPVLDAMLGDDGLLRGVAHAQGVRPPKRLVSFFFANGTYMANWTPAAQGTDYALSPMLAPLAPVRQHVAVVSGLTKVAGPQDFAILAHARTTGTFATGMPVTPTGVLGPSFDQVAAARIGGTTRIRSLALGVEPSTRNVHLGCISWSGTSTPLPAQTSPTQVFATLFGRPVPAGAPDYRRSVLDAVAQDATRLSARLGGEDRARVDAHLTAIRELERRIMAPLAATCAVPAAPAATLAENTRALVMIDLLVMALRCDLTRVASFMLRTGGSNAPLPWLRLAQSHHTYSHMNTAEGRAAQTQYTAYAVERFAYLVRRLSEVREGDGTLLDNSLLFCSSEMAEGTRHTYDNMPVLLAGRAGGALGVGRHVRFAPGTSLNDLFVSLLNLVDVPVTRFGFDGSRTLPGLTV